MFGFLKSGPIHSLTFIYPSTNHPNMVGCPNDYLDPNRAVRMIVRFQISYAVGMIVLDQNSKFDHILGHIRT